MNAQQQSAYTDAGLPEFDPQSRAAFIAGWRAACKLMRAEALRMPSIPPVITHEVFATTKRAPQ